MRLTRHVAAAARGRVLRAVRGRVAHRTDEVERARGRAALIRFDRAARKTRRASRGHHAVVLGVEGGATLRHRLHAVAHREIDRSAARIDHIGRSVARVAHRVRTRVETRRSVAATSDHCDEDEECSHTFSRSISRDRRRDGREDPPWTSAPFRDAEKELRDRGAVDRSEMRGGRRRICRPLPDIVRGDD